MPRSQDKKSLGRASRPKQAKQLRKKKKGGRRVRLTEGQRKEEDPDYQLLQGSKTQRTEITFPRSPSVATKAEVWNAWKLRVGDDVAFSLDTCKELARLSVAAKDSPSAAVCTILGDKSIKRARDTLTALGPVFLKEWMFELFEERFRVRYGKDLADHLESLWDLFDEIEREVEANGGVDPRKPGPKPKKKIKQEDDVVEIYSSGSNESDDGGSNTVAVTPEMKAWVRGEIAKSQGK